MTTHGMNPEARIPAEILSEIFHLLCDEPIALEQLENSSCFHDFPWAVGQVCGRWRTAFLSHPPLWTSFSLCNPFPDPSAAYFAEMNRRSAIYLKRSGQLPLALIIAIDTDTSILTTWKMLVSCSNRWRNAGILVPSTGTIIGDALLECRGRFPILESLTICKPGYKYTGCHDIFEIAPHLTELNLELFDGWLGTWIRFPWSQLTKLGLTMSYVSRGFTTGTCGSELRALLLQLQNVEDLQLAIPNLDTPLPDFKFPPVRLTRLRSLRITVVLASIVFSWFELPFLQHIWLDSQYLMFIVDISEELDACREEITSLIDRSSCRIRQLTLEWCSDKIAHTIMETLPSVEELYIKNLGIDSCIVRDISDRIYLPKMRVLQVNCCPGRFGGLVADLSHLLKMRSKESTGLSTLERLTIRVDWGNCDEPCCVAFPESRTLDSALQAMSSWPSFSVTKVHSDQSNKRSVTLNAHALAGGTLVDLTFYYPNLDPDFTAEICRYYSVLEQMCCYNTERSDS